MPAIDPGNHDAATMPDWSPIGSARARFIAGMNSRGDDGVTYCMQGTLIR
ncbi:MAG TPA: hypothetical protein VF798_11935 [Burkholderiaceae bacterium]